MANVAASAKLGGGFGPIFPNQSAKCVCVSFATTDATDTLIFDTSNVGKENAIKNIRFAIVVGGSGAYTSIVVASNLMTVVGLGNNAAATNCVALIVGDSA